MYMHRGENEELVGSPELKQLEEKVGYPIEITEEIYNNQEHGELPEWIDVTLKDEGVLPFKMARGVINTLEGASSISFDKLFDVQTDPQWGAPFNARLEIFNRQGIYIVFNAKHHYEEIELCITDFFNDTIGV
jgi:hypothetical protein